MAFRTAEHIREMTRNWMNKFGVNDDVVFASEVRQPIVAVEQIERQPTEEILPR